MYAYRIRVGKRPSCVLLVAVNMDVGSSSNERPILGECVRATHVASSKDYRDRAPQKGLGPIHVNENFADR